MSVNSLLHEKKFLHHSTIVKVFETGNPVIGNICTYITSRGERKMSLTSTYPIKEDGKVIGVYEVAEDSMIAHHDSVQSNCHLVLYGASSWCH